MTLQQPLLRFALPALTCLLLGPHGASASDGNKSSFSEMELGLHPVDWAIIVTYAIATIALGVYFGRKQKSASEYFIGSGHMNPLLIGVSLFATLLSTISYLSLPGEAAGKGPVMLVGLLTYPIIYVIVAYGLLPLYMRQRVTSAYELLESQLGLSIRLLGAILFLSLRLVWMTLLVYLAAKALTVMMGVDPSWIPWIVLVTGIVSVIYTSLGGLQAVVITDLMQTILLFSGALLVLLTVTWHGGGLGWFPTQWQDHWDTQPLFSLSPKTRITVLGTIVSIATWYVCTSGSDQTTIQRYMATRDLRHARRALAVQLCVGASVSLLLTLVGFALLSYFQTNADLLSTGMELKKDADDLFPRFIAYHLPIGISGLVVAAMFAAAMSSIDSGVNSVTAVVMTDFLGRFNWKPTTDKGQVLVARGLAFLIGVTVVLGSSYIGYIPGNITAMTNKTVNLLTSPIFALFFLALFMPRASTAAAWTAAISGTVVAIVIAFSGPLVYWLYIKYGVDPITFGVGFIEKVDPVTGTPWTTCEDPISFQWIGITALLASLSSAWLVSHFFPRRP